MKKTSVFLLTAFAFSFGLKVSVCFGDDAAISQTDARSAQQSAEGNFDLDANEAQKNMNKINEYAAKAKALGVTIADGQIAELSQAVTHYVRFHSTCSKTQAAASWTCREKTSPNLQKTLGEINMVASMISGAAIKDACSTFAKVAALGEAGLTAYTAACSAARGACETACSNVKSNLDQINKLLDSHVIVDTCTPPPNNQIANTFCNEWKRINVQTPHAAISTTAKLDASGDPASIATKNQACTYEYTSMILAAGIGITSLINSYKQGQKCDKDTNGATATAAATIDCTLVANMQTQTCICKAQPNNPGCSTALSAKSVSLGNGLSANSTPPGGGINSNKSGGLDLNGDGGLGGDPARHPTSDSGASGAPPPSGGGSGLGGGGGSSGGSGGSGSAAGKSLSANILGGAGSGGGGGGGWGAGGSGDSEASRKLRGYLPGGDKDPNKMAGQQNWAKEVTGQGGKSNWEKVRDRYRDNNTSLLSN